MVETLTVKLTQGMVAIIDRSDLCLVGGVKWCAHIRKHKYVGDSFYAVGKIDGKQVKMHRVILGLTDYRICVDHINRNGLDNRRSNLRLATNSQNQGNMKSNSGTSIYKGVSFDTRRMMWRACIRKYRKTKHLGYFDNEEVAAQAYNDAAVEVFGEFARINLLPTE